MKISTKGKYALQSMVILCNNFLNGNPLMSLKEISTQSGVSANYLQQIFILLRKADIIIGLKGANSGYMFKMDVNKITVGTIFKAVENSFSEVSTEVDSSENIIDSHLSSLYKTIINCVDNIYLIDLAKKYEIEKTNDYPIDYNI